MLERKILVSGLKGTFIREAPYLKFCLLEDGLLTDCSCTPKSVGVSHELPTNNTFRCIFLLSGKGLHSHQIHILATSLSVYY